MQRGEVWWASLGEPRGSEPGHRRPVLILSSDDFNESRIATVVIATISTNLKLIGAPGNVSISRRDSGLREESVVNVSQILTVNKSGLTERVATLQSRTMARVDDGLRLVLSI